MEIEKNQEMGRTKKKDSSVVFIGESDDKEPLLDYQDGWGWRSGNTGKRGRTLQNKKKTTNWTKPFPSSFVKYLFSETSVIIRILSSLCPPVGRFKRIAVDFSGSFLCTFLLSVTLYWGLVNSKGEPRLVSLLYASVLTLGYLLMVSLFTWTVSKCTKTTITLRQIVCVLGYGLFGHALVLLICEVGSDEWFMPLMTIIGGLDSVRICLILLARTPIPAYRFVLCTPVAIIHLLYLVYLHFAIMKH